jgi:aryl-alcohol dehydrogenase-like predicted oxidoreductase
MATLQTALLAGVRLIHSNPKLFTQWAVREVLQSLDSTSEIRHLVKAEVPLGNPDRMASATLLGAIDTSMDRLGVDRLHAVILEIDMKRTVDGTLHKDPGAVGAFYRDGASLVLSTGVVDRVLAYCTVPSHLAPALECHLVSGVAAQYNLGERWASDHLGAIDQAGKIFVGMSPLGRGTLVSASARDTNARLAPLRWALLDPRVSAVAITMSTVQHFMEVAQVIRRSSIDVCEAK